MGKNDAKEEKQDKGKPETAKVNPIHPGDRRGHGKRHLLDTCE
ncbi:hypothetical protein [uncultured Methanomethylovorans sp.]|nr:hypothetical protein [uncultured Methanomethylovorans sp.]